MTQKHTSKIKQLISCKLRGKFSHVPYLDGLSAMTAWNDFSLGAILMLHRVGKPKSNGIAANQGLRISEDYLFRILEEYSTRGFRFTSMDEVCEIIAKPPAKRRYADKFIAISLDDGYRDNLLNAAPIFRHFSAPYAIYVSSGLAEGRPILWWDKLERYLLLREEIQIDGETVQTRSPEEKNAAFLRIRKIVLGEFHPNIASQISQLDPNFNPSEYPANDMMNWDDIINISADPLCTIGGHTVNHYPLSQLPESMVLEEIRTANLEISSKIGMPVKHFAFPYGGPDEVDSRTIDIARQADIRSAVLAYGGKVQYASDIYSLPRIMIKESHS